MRNEKYILEVNIYIYVRVNVESIYLSLEMKKYSRYN